MNYEKSYDRQPSPATRRRSGTITNAERIATAVGGGALIAYGIKSSDITGALMSIAGVALAARAAAAHSTPLSENPLSPFYQSWISGPVHVSKSVTINKSAAELYQFWRDFENLPKFMNHIEAVNVVDEQHSHWTAKAPLGYTVEWDAEITSDVVNEKIGWNSIEGSDIANSGVVQFLPTTNRGTEVKIAMTYEAPAGKIGELAAKLFGEEPGQQVAEDLRRFKSLMETGLIMRVEGQPSGREEFPKKSMSARA